MKTRHCIFFFLLALFFAACTPKTTETVQVEEQPVTPPAPPAEEDDLSPCAKFTDAPDPDEAETNYVLYRDFLRAGDWNQAFGLWKKVYQEAPAADGRRNTVFADGIRFYEYFISQTQDSLQKEAYVDTIFMIYDGIEECYAGGGYVPARKGFDLFYKYPQRASNRKEIYDYFTEAISIDSMETNDFVLNPFTAVLVELFDAGAINKEEAFKYQQLIRDRLAIGLADCKGVYCDRWKIIEEYVPVRLEYFETVKGFYPCEYYMEKYYPVFEANQEDCDIVREVYSRLNFAECAEDDERFKALIRIGNENCAPEPGPAEVAYDHLKNARYPEAIEAFKVAIEEEEDITKKARYTLLIAKIYQVHLRNFPKARTWALQAAEVRSGWGEPYILIGRMYASSGPLCGPGRGWDSQIVTWPAIDMWQKAKRVDPSVAAEANKWINRYSQYMPNREDVFIRNLKAGQNFYVGCWIQRSTKIRTSD
jgi:tetratricopeptide (TPR) repeat protein